MSFVFDRFCHSMLAQLSLQACCISNREDYLQSLERLLLLGSIRLALLSALACLVQLLLSALCKPFRGADLCQQHVHFLSVCRTALGEPILGAACRLRSTVPRSAGQSLYLLQTEPSSVPILCISHGDHNTIAKQFHQPKSPENASQELGSKFDVMSESKAFMWLDSTACQPSKSLDNARQGVGRFG